MTGAASVPLATRSRRDAVGHRDILSEGYTLAAFRPLASETLAAPVVSARFPLTRPAPRFMIAGIKYIRR